MVFGRPQARPPHAPAREGLESLRDRREAAAVGAIVGSAGVQDSWFWKRGPPLAGAAP